jgi:hypothetical protein
MRALFFWTKKEGAVSTAPFSLSWFYLAVPGVITGFF